MHFTQIIVAPQKEFARISFEEKEMALNDFVHKLRHWDNAIARWMLRHVYYMFFQMVLLVIFFFWLFNMFNVIELNFETSPESSTIDRLLSSQSINITILVFLLFLNSFWLLYIFSGMQRIVNLLKDLNFHMSRMRSFRRDKPPQKYS